MKKNRLFFTRQQLLAAGMAFLTAFGGLNGVSGTAYGAEYADEVQITVDPGADRQPISPYIYGINDGGVNSFTHPQSIRMGGNRLTAYNWENNYSNAGSDWNHSSDTHLIGGLDASIAHLPGAVALGLSAQATEHEIPYTLMTVPMAGYVAADGNGTVTEEEAAPSNRWCQVVARKDAPFSLTPDPEDGTVYVDEFVNYLVQTLGDASTATGIKAYSLDNEPALWSGTHSRVHPLKPTCAEITARTVEYAAAIKDVDPKAEIFGPALYGFNAYTTFQSAEDWNAIAAEGGYRWFVDYYLDEMKKAEKTYGKRLLDVFDVHYYTEALGACGERSCNHYDNEDCIDARLQSVRTLDEEGYIEDSWIGQWGQDFLPILPNLRQSIDTYYPGTKLGISEYNFGGGDHISGGIAQADAFGTFAKNGVYFATLWLSDTKAVYQWNAYQLFTNYDGEGAGFGDTLVRAETSDVSTVGVYAAIDGEDESTLRVILTNKNQHGPTKVTLSLAGDTNYQTATVYGLYTNTFGITKGDTIAVTNHTITYEVPSLCVVELVIQTAEAAANNSAAPTVTAPPASSTGDSAGDLETEKEPSDDASVWRHLVPALVAILVVVAAGFGIHGFRKKKK